MKKIFNFKIRSLPNSKNFFEYFDLFVYILGTMFVFNFVYIMLIADGFNPFIPLAYVIIFPFAFAVKYSEIENRNKTITKDDFRELIIDMRQGQWQKFKEKIEERPEYLTAHYKGRTLFYWCKHYRDYKANKLIIEELRNLNRKVGE